jgi:outer membrane protein TolC
MSRRAAWNCAGACVVLLSACTVGPNFEAPEPPAAPSYAAPGDMPLPPDQRINLGTRTEGDWWSQLHCAALDSLIREALENNQDIAAARARVAQAREEVNAARATLFPSLTFGTTAGRQKYGKALFGPLDFVIPPFTY